MVRGAHSHTLVDRIDCNMLPATDMTRGNTVPGLATRCCLQWILQTITRVGSGLNSAVRCCLC
eukprot:COSAG01_NODE_59538_length_299_cov_6.235000_1_plen_62_part_10